MADEPDQPATRRVSLLTLGCARNEVDSEELAGRLAEHGWELVEDSASADAVVVNTCGFVESAKKDSIDTILAAADGRDDVALAGRKQAVVAVGCMAERYGAELAEALPEADAVLGFDDYPEIADVLSKVLAGHGHEAHTPADRRRLLPLAPAERPDADVFVPGHVAIPDLPEGVGPASGPVRRRLDSGPVASLKLASGCDRRCSFCAIPSFRGSFVSRRPTDVIAEARWLAAQGVRELVLVSENSTSYGKDLGDNALLEKVLWELDAIAGIDRIRVSYLQPAEMRPALIDAMAEIPSVANYFDLSFQHSSASVLRRMRRFGSTSDFLSLIERIRRVAPDAGIRSNVIVGFPGETEDELAELEQFLVEARLDAIGVFGYSDEEGTEAAGLDGKLERSAIAERVARVSELVEDLMSRRAEERVGSVVEVLVESVVDDMLEGRAGHQGPEDGSCMVFDVPAAEATIGGLAAVEITQVVGVDLIGYPKGLS